nr:hypothetical protein [Tanacetum cinerariifolium]
MMTNQRFCICLQIYLKETVLHLLKRTRTRTVSMEKSCNAATRCKSIVVDGTTNVVLLAGEFSRKPTRLLKIVFILKI